MEGAFGKIEAGNLERSNVDINYRNGKYVKNSTSVFWSIKASSNRVDITKRLLMDKDKIQYF